MSQMTRSVNSITNAQPDEQHGVPTLKAFERMSDYTDTFLEAVADEAGVDSNDAEPIDATKNDTGLQFLVGYSDGTRILIGRDETSTASGLFAVIIDSSENERIRTVDQGIDSLRPEPVRVAERSDGVQVQRQGEWWFVETNEGPEFDVSGELGSKPYGPSPLENHVVTGYGFGLEREQVLRELSLYASDGECDQVFDRIPQCFDSIRNQTLVWGRTWSGRFREFDWHRISDVCNGVFVRGTVRHRDREHYMLSLGERWHTAYTHNKTVYQPLPTTYGNGSILISNASYVD